jgi:polysaccharide chain length determinant protein (PEP-CTERM system associated)
MLPNKTYTPEDFVRMAWRHRWRIVVPAVVVASLAAGFAMLLPERYRSETTILVVPQRVPESYVRSTVTIRIEDRLQAIRQQILSRTRLERIIQEFNLYERERQTWIMEDVVARMRGDVTVEVVRDDAFRVVYIGSEPRTVMRVTDRLASLVIDENLRDRELQAEGTNQFLESQLEEARRRLVEQEQKLAEYQRRFAGELPQQATANLQVLQNSQMQIQSLVESLNRDHDRRASLERSITELEAEEPEAVVLAAPPNPQAPTGARTLPELLAASEEQLRELLLRLTPEHPDVARARRVIEELRAKVEAETQRRPLSAEVAPVTAALSPAEIARRNRLVQLKGELEALDRQMVAKQAEERRLQERVTAYQARVEGVPIRQAELTELTRDYGTLQGLYNNLLAKMEDSRIAANLERRQIGEQFKLLDPASLPEKPYTPNRLQINLFGAVFGLGLGLALAAILEYRDTSCRTEDDVVAVLSLPVLARIPVMLNGLERRKVRRMRIAMSVTAAVLVLLGVSGAVAWRLGALDDYRITIESFLTQRW